MAALTPPVEGGGAEGHAATASVPPQALQPRAPQPPAMALCRYWAASRGCKRLGLGCRGAHPDAFFVSNLCRAFHQRGGCHRGDVCSFIHDDGKTGRHLALNRIAQETLRAGQSRQQPPLQRQPTQPPLPPHGAAAPARALTSPGAGSLDPAILDHSPVSSEGPPVIPAPPASTISNIKSAMGQLWWLNPGSEDQADLSRAWGALFNQMNALGEEPARAEAQEMLSHLEWLENHCPPYGWRQA